MWGGISLWYFILYSLNGYDVQYFSCAYGPFIYILKCLPKGEKEISRRWRKKMSLLHSLEVNSAGGGGHCTSSYLLLLLHLVTSTSKKTPGAQIPGFEGQGFYCPTWLSQAVCHLFSIRAWLCAKGMGMGNG